jgi:predicted transcriptional regulator of viral defense system
MRRIETFFALHPVFTVEEAKRYLARFKEREGSIANLLYYHHKQGRILPIRRGLYYVVPPGTTIETCPVDAYLIAGRMAKDAVLAYHSALSLHGHAHSTWYLFHYYTKNRAKKPFAFRDCTYQAVSIPSALVKSKKTDFGLMTIERMGVKIAVTTLERTMVDILDRPYLAGSWEEIWKSLEGIEYLDLDMVIEYVLLLSNQLTIAKVGYFLDTHREQFRVSNVHLEKLHQHLFMKPNYLERSSKEPQKLIRSWNLIIPQTLYNRNWEEPHGDL